VTAVSSMEKRVLTCSRGNPGNVESLVSSSSSSVPKRQESSHVECSLMPRKKKDEMNDLIDHILNKDGTLKAIFQVGLLLNESSLTWRLVTCMNGLVVVQLLETIVVVVSSGQYKPWDCTIQS
jgi:hypothetical protein